MVFLFLSLQFNWRTEWKTRDTKDEARGDGLVAEDIS
jgi:hypothetical protein